MDRRWAWALVPVNLALALGAIGCGAGGGVAGNATVSVYVSAPLHGAEAKAGRGACAGARAELARGGGRAGDVRVRVICLDDSGGGQRWRLAAVGADARRAAEDSTTVAYVAAIDPVAARFSRPVVEAAGIAQVSGASGRLAMARVLKAIREAGGAGQLRETVAKALGGTREPA